MLAALTCSDGAEDGGLFRFYNSQDGLFSTGLPCDCYSLVHVKGQAAAVWKQEIRH